MKMKTSSKTVRKSKASDTGKSDQTTTKVRDAKSVRPSADVGVREGHAKVTKDGPQTSRNSKIAMLVQLMRQARGASTDQLVKATGWQKHSVRGAISGQVKKKLGLAVTSTKIDGVRHYRIGR